MRHGLRRAFPVSMHIHLSGRRWNGQPAIRIEGRGFHPPVGMLQAEPPGGPTRGGREITKQPEAGGPRSGHGGEQAARACSCSDAITSAITGCSRTAGASRSLCPHFFASGQMPPPSFPPASGETPAGGHSDTRVRPARRAKPAPQHWRRKHLADAPHHPCPWIEAEPGTSAPVTRAASFTRWDHRADKPLWAASSRRRRGGVGRPATKSRRNRQAFGQSENGQASRPSTRDARAFDRPDRPDFRRNVARSGCAWAHRHPATGLRPGLKERSSPMPAKTTRLSSS